MALIKDALSIAANLLLPKINLKRQSTYMSSEIFAYNSRYTDPLTLSFKVIFEYGKPYGLFADEEYTNSALAYLKRIGAEERYQLLKNWIEVWKQFMRYYDWLFLTVDGLDALQNANPQDHFKEEEAKLTFSIREPIDMTFQSLLTVYRQIWFDDVRQVEVLPANLRRFDMYVLVYPVGIYNSVFYDEYGNPEPYSSILTKAKDKAKGLINDGVDKLFGNDKKEKGEDPNVELNMFPTSRKLLLGDSNAVLALSKEYNHQMYIFGDCQINNTESGKTFATSVSNEPGSDIVKNTLCLSYRFGRYKGRFNNVFGNIDISKVLSDFSKAQKEMTILTDREKLSVKEKLSASYKGLVGGLLKSAASNLMKDIGSKAVDKLDSALGQMIGGGTSPIGNVYKDYDIFNPNYLTRMVKSTFEQGMNIGVDKFVGGFNRLDNIMYNNFTSEMFGLYTDVFRRKSQANRPKEIKSSDTPKMSPAPNKPELLEDTNIYKRKNF